MIRFANVLLLTCISLAVSAQTVFWLGADISGTTAACLGQSKGWPLQ